MDEHSTRRGFLEQAGAAALGLLLGSPPLCLLAGRRARAGDPLAALIETAPVARFWTAAQSPGVTCASCHAPGEVETAGEHDHGSRVVRCLLCARRCLLGEGQRGMCRARINAGGELRTLVYGRPIAVHVDPIEKKPFYHFLPGSSAYSIATSGCPLRCRFCQNWEISQARPEDYSSPPRPPAELARDALGRRAPVIAFTYNEPTVFFEYLVDIAAAAKERGIRSVLISCGYMNEAPLAEMLRSLAAVKIDLKGFSPEFYRKVADAELAPVLRSVKQVSKSGVHLEIVNLVVPGLNDTEPLLRELSKWVVGELGPDVPVHFTRFHPDYQLRNLAPTPVATLERARAIAMEQGIRYAFAGNVPGHPGNNTYCPRCGKIVIARQGFFVAANELKEGRCAVCGEAIAGVWS